MRRRFSKQVRPLSAASPLIKRSLKVLSSLIVLAALVVVLGIAAPASGNASDIDQNEPFELFDPRLGRVLLPDNLETLFIGLEETLIAADDEVKRWAIREDLTTDDLSCWAFISGGKFPTNVACGPLTSPDFSTARIAMFDVVINDVEDLTEMAAVNRDIGFDDAGVMQVYALSPTTLEFKALYEAEPRGRDQSMREENCVDPNSSSCYYFYFSVSRLEILALISMPMVG